jgi:hypothetical protein
MDDARAVKAAKEVTEHKVSGTLELNYSLPPSESFNKTNWALVLEASKQPSIMDFVWWFSQMHQLLGLGITAQTQGGPFTPPTQCKLIRIEDIALFCDLWRQGKIQKFVEPKKVEDEPARD